MTKIYGHRGASKVCPENTMAAYIKALELGAEGLEIDVHLTKDGIPVVIHDETVKRTTNGKGYVKTSAFQKLNCWMRAVGFLQNFKTNEFRHLRSFFSGSARLLFCLISN